VKELRIYTEKDTYIIEREDESKQLHKEIYDSQEAFFDAVKCYRPTIHSYYLSVEEGTGIFHRIHYILFA